MDVQQVPNTRQRCNTNEPKDKEKESSSKEVFGSPTFKLPRSKRGREGSTFSSSRLTKRQMGGDSSLASPNSVSPGTRSVQMGSAPVSGSRTRRQSVVRSLGLWESPDDSPSSTTSEKATAVTQSTPPPEKDKINDSSSFSLEFKGLKSPLARTNEKVTAVTHSTSFPKENENKNENNDSSSFSLEFKVPLPPSSDISSPVPMKPPSHKKKPRSSPQKVPTKALASSTSSSPLSERPIGASSYSLSGWKDGRRGREELFGTKSSQQDGVRRSSRRSLSLSLAGGVGESGRLEDSSEKEKGSSLISPSSSFTPVKTLDVKRNLSEMFLKEGRVDNRGGQGKETFAERRWEGGEEENKGFDDLEKRNVQKDTFQKESFLRDGKDSEVFPLDGDVLLRSPSSLDLDRTREFEQDPVFRGMQFMGCEHQYTDAHYARFLQQEEKNIAGKTLKGQ